jgi:hypothetical protein
MESIILNTQRGLSGHIGQIKNKIMQSWVIPHDPL